MAPTTPTRFDDELYASAKAVVALTGRRTDQQLAYWARVGREFEAGESISQRSIAEALAGEVPYDRLTSHEQAVVRTVWVERMDACREALDFAAEFAAAGQPYVGLDAQGRVVRYAAGGAVLEVVAPGEPARS
jgi:hypothetical protein